MSADDCEAVFVTEAGVEKQVPWRRLRRFPPHPVPLGDQDGADAVEPLTQGVAGSWHA